MADDSYRDLIDGGSVSTARRNNEACMSLYTCLIIMAGGALGILARYLISVLAAPISGNLPWGTIIINITGSFIITVTRWSSAAVKWRA